MSNNDAEVSLLRGVPRVASPSRLLHPARVSPALMGLLSDVGLLSIADDLRVAGRVLLGGGKSLIINVNGSMLITIHSHQTFHLRDIRWERQFLSKSFMGFLAFNLLPYSLFGAEVSANCEASRAYKITAVELMLRSLPLNSPDFIFVMSFNSFVVSF